MVDIFDQREGGEDKSQMFLDNISGAYPLFRQACIKQGVCFTLIR
jgi:hypothetical protein